MTGRRVTRIVLVEAGSACSTAVPLARALRDEGAEVVHAGVLRTREEIVATAEQEDPDVLAVSAGSAADQELADGLAAALPELRVVAFATDTDVTRWVEENATCATDPSSEALR
ncbi:hypothetical protein DI005_30785 [Prauserella sp. PE36]|uniref:cobalamin B12-binding domain-containing protein n=1 Tax=Prauserella sp. PE36 TaxID=1504709 RepID=UPI000D940BEF|nr:cobalamin-dependent protein [Prauserella sp. PE36]PXY17245.1 hypothetical protein BAY59_37455 [Prauserella coralliicola]RBM13572.1 hypothetical protein DI005_30785 [Prauserella sp. PE36]